MKGLQDPVFALDEQEQSLLARAYIQMLVVRAVLYAATKKGEYGFAPVPAMIVAMMVKAAYECANGVKAHFLPHNRLDNQYPRYSSEIVREGFWWDRETIRVSQNELMAISDIPDAMRAVLIMLISEHSVLHPNGLMAVKMSSWWQARRCGNNRDNLWVHLTEENCKEAEFALQRLGDENAQWCEAIGEVMSGYNDQNVVDSFCGECHPTL